MKKFQVFTPKQYVDLMLDEAGYFGKDILGKNFLENSVGDGNVLVQAVIRYINEWINSGSELTLVKSDLENFFTAFEVDKEVLEKCINRLNGITEKFGVFGVQWNIRNEDYLKSELDKKFDFIIGNPPYITYQELKIDDRNYLRDNFLSCSKGKFDYCYAFIEKSLDDLAPKTGKMSYLIPNSLFKNVFAQNLRTLILTYLTRIIDYKYTGIFEKVITSSAIIVIDKSVKLDEIAYQDFDNTRELVINKFELEDKWYFENDPQVIGGVRFGDLFKISNSVATLSNSIFLVPDGIDLEKELIRPAVSPRKLSKNIKENIIFPYRYDSGKFLRYSEEEFKSLFPKGVKYLHENKKNLDNRKADGLWFEYGRSQALQYMNQNKLMISSVVTDRVRVYELDKQTIPYSGFYIIPLGDISLDFAKKILESEEFYKYIESRAINASGRSLRLSVNDIRSYLIPREEI